MDTTCIITGIILVSPDRDEWVAGDLFLQGETLIVNANVLHGDTNWNELDSDNWSGRGKVLYLGTEFFERRGVFVVNREDCELSHEAIAYVIKNGGTNLV